MYMMISPPPPKTEWEVMERVLNQLLKDSAVEHTDLKVLEEYKDKCHQEGKEILDNPGDPHQLKTNDPKFIAVFNFCATNAIVSLVQAQHKQETFNVNNEIITALTAARQLHEIAYPILQKAVGEWFQLKGMVS